MIGEVLDGKYRVERRLGKGGFGSVYECRDLRLERPVAVKVLDSVDGDLDFRQRFRREMQTMARLRHPHIVTIFDSGEHEGRPYHVMELVRGCPLAEVAARSPLAVEEAIPLALQVCDAMSYAHTQGVVHRDLSLGNVMMEAEEGEPPRVKILDFGLAKLLHDRGQTTGRILIGTPNYMAPEQIRCETIDPRTDIFAFGVCLYRLLHERFPFEAEHRMAVLYQILNEPEVRCSAELPSGMVAILLRCLEKDPQRRYASFAEVRDDLAQLREALAGPSGKDASTLALAAPLPETRERCNPYLNRVMIRNPADFFGREREIRRIYSRLDAPHPQSISVVGERRIGKSSLLNYVYHPGNRRLHMRNHADTTFVYLDFQSDVSWHVEKFIDYLFGVFGLESRTGRRFLEGPRSLDRLKEAVQEMHEEGRRIILLMDEFETITRNENFEEGFFSFLRALANSYRVAYVTSSCDELQTMCHNRDIADSPFFNIFSNLPLRPFTPDVARRLVVEPSAAVEVPLEPHADRLIGLAGCFPLFLQIACSTLFDNLQDRGDAGPDWDWVERTFEEEAFPHYDFVWERMEGPERDNLLRIAGGRKVSPKFAFASENLVRRGYLVEAADGLRLCSRSFERYVLKQGGGRSRRLPLLGWLPRRGG